MPRQSKGARLAFRPSKRRNAKRHDGTWVIRDGQREISTGAGYPDRASAQDALDRYILGKRTSPQNQALFARPYTATAVFSIADVLTLYLQDKAPFHARPKETAARALKLIEFFCDPGLVRETACAFNFFPDTFVTYAGFVSDISPLLCRLYMIYRTRQISADQFIKDLKTYGVDGIVARPAVRRELEDLKAALFYAREKQQIAIVPVLKLPRAPEARVVWLTRAEVAKLLRALWRKRDPLTGSFRTRHLARWLLLALYSGSRASVLASASVVDSPGSSWIDTETGEFFRTPHGRVSSLTKRTPTCILPDRMMAHIRRWADKGIADPHIITYGGGSVTRPGKRALADAARKAGIHKNVTPHVLRHTAATLMCQAGISPELVCEYLGMTMETLRKHYLHHHPDYVRRAANQFAAHKSYNQVHSSLPRYPQKRA